MRGKYGCWRPVMLETRGWRGVRRWAMRVSMVRVGCCCGSWVVGVTVVAVDNDQVSENEEDEEEEEENKPGDWN